MDFRLSILTIPIIWIAVFLPVKYKEKYCLIPSVIVNFNWDNAYEHLNTVYIV